MAAGVVSLHTAVLRGHTPGISCRIIPDLSGGLKSWLLAGQGGQGSTECCGQWRLVAGKAGRNPANLVLHDAWLL